MIEGWGVENCYGAHAIYQAAPASNLALDKCSTLNFQVVSQLKIC
jgi:hypothetical protein